MNAEIDAATRIMGQIWTFPDTRPADWQASGHRILMTAERRADRECEDVSSAAQTAWSATCLSPEHFGHGPLDTEGLASTRQLAARIAKTCFGIPA
jgi:hypothetical protein